MAWVSSGDAFYTEGPYVKKYACSELVSRSLPGYSKKDSVHMWDHWFPPQRGTYKRAPPLKSRPKAG